MLSTSSSPAIALASASPRRQELLALTGWGFQVCPATVSEAPEQEEEPRKLAVRLALKKAAAAAGACPAGSMLIAADTLVVHGQEVLGKPANDDEAIAMLDRLRGREHVVITGLALDFADQSSLLEICETRVPMRDYRAEEIRVYVAGGSPFDKAGGYGIQDVEFRPVDHEKFAGCYANVMGLPLCHLVRSMRQQGFEPPMDVPRACHQFTGYDCTIYPTILRGES